MKKESNFWTKEKCKEESTKYNNIEEFRKNSMYAYIKSYKNNWLCDFYYDYIKPKIKWTKEKCKEEALKYNRRIDFITNSKIAYSIALRKNWLNDVCCHMNKKPMLYWTIEICSQEALKYKTKTEFKKCSYQAYKASYINCWLDDVCKHMPKIGNKYKRCIYAFQFSDNKVYVGLTYNINEREKQHYFSIKSAVKKYCDVSGLTPILVKLTDYINVDLAKKQENYYINFYKEKGWTVLNTYIGGNAGSDKRIYNEEFCEKIVSNYIYLEDLRKENEKIYKIIIKRKWYNILDVLIKKKSSPPIKWTKEICEIEALKYKTKKEFKENNVNAYNACVRNKWIQDICNHMIKK